MNLERLLALYEQVADAPDAVARLRRFVLDLAVRGKLVAQDASDEPASELLKRIAAEKARLVKAGEIRKPRDLANGESLELPFDIPASWRWCRLDAVGAIIGGGTPSAGKHENFAGPGKGIPWLTPADLGKYRDLFIKRGSRDLTEKGLSTSSATLMPAGTVLFTSRAPIGYVAIAANLISTNQGFKSIVPYVLDCSRFVALAMQTFAPEIDARAPGTTFKEVSGKIVAGVPFPLPPLAEQRRIVAKVEELMALLDRLEAARNAREAARDRLTAASLAHLTVPDIDPAEFPANARFVLDKLPELTARTEQIKSIRQTILNLAVRGKLVEQDPTDEPASELLNRIAAERMGIAKKTGAKLKKPITRDVKFAEVALPNGWVWSQFDELAWKITDGDHQTPKREVRGRYLLSARNVLDGQIDVSNVDFVGEAEFQRMRSRCDPDRYDILISCSGSVGRVAIVDKDNAYVLVRSAALVKLAFGKELSGYIQKVLLSDILKEQIGVRSKAAAQPNLFLGQIRQLMLPLPPLAEQHRIVAKVDALMALCDRLEAAIAEADTARTQLLEALLHEALAEPNARLEAAE